MEERIDGWLIMRKERSVGSNGLSEPGYSCDHYEMKKVVSGPTLMLVVWMDCARRS